MRRLNLRDLTGFIVIALMICVATVSAINFADFRDQAAPTLAEGPLVVNLKQSLRLPLHSFLEATITTDKDDYSPGEIALITGSGFQAGETVRLQVVHISAPGVTETEPHAGHDPWDVVADSRGNVSASWLVGEDSLDQYLKLTADGLSSLLHAEHIFTDASGVDFAQCANNDTINGETPPMLLGRCHWIGSIVQQSNARYSEGMSNMQRIILFNFDETPGDVHRLTFDHDSTKGGVHAYDFLTSYEQAIAAAPASAPYQDVTGIAAIEGDEIHSATLSNARACGVEIGPPNTLGATCIALRAGVHRANVPLPDDPYVDSNDGSTLARIMRYEQLYGNRYLRVYANAPINSASVQLFGPNSGHDGPDTGDSMIHYMLTVDSAATAIMVEVAGHLSKSGAFADDNLNWGAGQGSSQISGGPYHFNLRRFNTDEDGDGGDSLGAQDNQIKGADIQLPQGSITIIKDAVPNHAQDFGFTTTGVTLSPFSLDDDAGATGADSTLSTTKQFTSLPAGNYSVTETGVAGWTLTNLVCVDATGGTTVNLPGRTVNINISAGEDVVCTFTNSGGGRIEIEKQTNPADSTQAFGFTGEIVTSLVDNGTSGKDVAPGQYSVSETALAGWDLTSIVCSDANSSGAANTATFNVEPGETVRCVFTNTQRAKIIVEKQTNPNGSTQSFAFTASYDGDGFSLTDNQQNDSGFLAPGGGYSVAETVPAGWDVDNVNCSDGSPRNNITLSAGETVTCVFTNTQRGKIIVEKQTNPNGSTQSFAFTASYDGDGFSLTDNQQNDSGFLAPGGGYSVAETVPAGWDVDNVNCSDGSPRNNITLSAGETVTCVFTNTQRGKIIVEKQTNPNGSTQSFAFTASYDADGFLLTDGQQNDSGFLAPNTYSVAEIVPTGWDVDNVVCSDGSPRTAISLQAGETITCVFTNTQRGAIKIVKNTVGGNGTFGFTPAGFGSGGFNLVTSGGTAMTTFSNIAAGNGYAIQEAVPTGWDLVSFTCDNGTIGAIVVVSGQTTTCTAVNRKRGSIKIIKDAVPDSAQDFSFDPSGLNGDVDFVLDDDADPTNSNMITFNNLLPEGSYSVVEGITPLWQLAGITCQSVGGTNNNTLNIATRSAVFNLEAGEEITCTFRNITVVGFVTSSSLCTFDVDPEKAGDQFRLLFTPDNSLSVYKQNASNPGQYYYNVLHYNDPLDPTDNSVTMNIPYPFVTHGATPVHVYSGVTVNQVDGESCLIPSGEVSNQQDQITLATYGMNPDMGVTTTSVTVPVPNGFSYVNIHLDYGLKRTTGYAKQIVGAMNNAIQTIGDGPDILDMQNYTFSNGGTHVVQSINAFKKNPGVGGLLRTLGEAPIPGQSLELRNSNGNVVAGPVTVDEDGWYFILFKHTAKAATYQVRWRETGLTKNVLLKANGMVQADFTP